MLKEDKTALIQRLEDLRAMHGVPETSPFRLFGSIIAQDMQHETPTHVQQKELVETSPFRPFGSVVTQDMPHEQPTPVQQDQLVPKPWSGERARERARARSRAWGGGREGGKRELREGAVSFIRKQRYPLAPRDIEDVHAPYGALNTCDRGVKH